MFVFKHPNFEFKSIQNSHQGAMDGMTYPEIAARFPADFEARRKDKLTYR